MEKSFLLKEIGDVVEFVPDVLNLVGKNLKCSSRSDGVHRDGVRAQGGVVALLRVEVVPQRLVRLVDFGQVLGGKGKFLRRRGLDRAFPLPDDQGFSGKPYINLRGINFGQLLVGHAPRPMEHEEVAEFIVGAKHFGDGSGSAFGDFVVKDAAGRVRFLSVREVLVEKLLPLLGRLAGLLVGGVSVRHVACAECFQKPLALLDVRALHARRRRDERGVFSGRSGKDENECRKGD